MIFLTDKECIAVENFSRGIIYHITLTADELYATCVGIGQNFVQFIDDTGKVFCLSEYTKAQYVSIDEYTPEPPAPLSDLLQYQTGTPPFNFDTSDTSLFSWYITGDGVGDKTANLFDKANDIEAYYLDGTTGEYKSTGSTSRTALIKCTGNETYTISAYSRTFRVAFYSTKPTNGTAAISFNNFDYGAYEDHSKTVTAPQNAEYMAFFCYNSGTEAQTYTENEIFSTVMINTGSTALPFEPYGYKIPILCNENLTNIYIDAPLSENEILYSNDVDTVITTDVGENTLTVETTVQPAEMQIVYKIADR